MEKLNNPKLHAEMLRLALVEYIRDHPKPWPAELRAFDVTGHCADALIRAGGNWAAFVVSDPGVHAEALFAARVEIALWLDRNAPNIHPASPRDQLVAYLAAHG